MNMRGTWVQVEVFSAIENKEEAVRQVEAGMKRAGYMALSHAETRVVVAEPDAIMPYPENNNAPPKESSSSSKDGTLPLWV